MNFTQVLVAGAALAMCASFAHAGVGADEAKQLGTTLTPVGAEKAGNSDGSIPAYAGGLTTPPPAYQAGSGIRPDPFTAEKPVMSISAKNMAQHESKLTAATMELMKRYPNSFRADVYPTHRTVAFPKYVTDNTAKNATSAKPVEGGVSFANAYAGFPFPIPKTGNEAMWNHLMRFVGHAAQYKFDAFNVDSAGKVTLATVGESIQEYPIYDPKRTDMLSDSDIFFRVKLAWLGPARRVGESLISIDSVNPMTNPRRAWIYLPGQRRVKLAPEVGYDTPNPGAAGMATYDDGLVFNGALDRFDFKLVGKKEIYVPYNTYKLSYWPKGEDVTTPNHINPDLVRWELHRVWVVEATVKPGKRHIYAKRVFYLDEDSWTILTSDQYDARGQLFRSSFAFLAPAYDVPAPTADGIVTYDLVAGSYSIVVGNLGKYYGNKFVPPLPSNEWSPDSLAGAGVR
jgi:Protein of unknown function (DUF1329)